MFHDIFVLLGTCYYLVYLLYSTLTEAELHRLWLQLYDCEGVRIAMHAAQILSYLAPLVVYYVTACVSEVSTTCYLIWLILDQALGSIILGHVADHHHVVDAYSQQIIVWCCLLSLGGIVTTCWMFYNSCVIVVTYAVCTAFAIKCVWINCLCSYIQEQEYCAL